MEKPSKFYNYINFGWFLMNHKKNNFLKVGGITMKIVIISMPMVATTLGKIVTTRNSIKC
jgi:hypothetical protein